MVGTYLEDTSTVSYLPLTCRLPEIPFHRVVGGRACHEIMNLLTLGHGSLVMAASKIWIKTMSQRSPASKGRLLHLKLTCVKQAHHSLVPLPGNPEFQLMARTNHPNSDTVDGQNPAPVWWLVYQPVNQTQQQDVVHRCCLLKDHTDRF